LRIRLMSVVFPLPRNPVRMVTGTILSSVAMTIWSFRAACDLSGVARVHRGPREPLRPRIESRDRGGPERKPRKKRALDHAASRGATAVIGARAAGPSGTRPRGTRRAPGG